MISRVPVFLLAALPAMIPSVASAQPIPVPINDVSHLAFRYLIEEIPTLGAPGSNASSNATGLNEQGDVAAVVEDDSLKNHAAIYRDGQLIVLDPIYPDGGASPRGINDLGDVCGYADAEVPPAVVAHPFLWAEEEGMVDLAADVGLLGGWAWGINNSGQVSLALGGKAYIWDPVTGLQELRYPDAPDGFSGAEAWEINNAGVVCGEARRQDNELHAFRYDSATDTITDLHDAAAFRMSRAYGINDNNDVAGIAVAYTHELYPMVWRGDGSAIQMGCGDVRPDLLYCTAEHINMRGDVIGHDSSVEPTPPVGWLAFDVLDGDLRKYTVESFLTSDERSTWSRFHPFEINEARQVCGIGLNRGNTRGFLLTPYPVVPGDFTTDFIVGFDDLLILLSNWDRERVRPLEGDADLDGDVDLDDLFVVISEWD